ncbi:hypothetical protein QFC22_004282 [Naganishia vaughanmartiniae]|uniref:Uncharacterized protein n=1 Tax=Naganishia vaughanmartiniae TaxID=1424756 RepID=A0ACC2X2B9_9TREE|nr:hypothetical protein QFC22_004282 [Naganishia vaughanmartiniae]
MQSQLPASPAPPSPVAPIEPGPRQTNAVLASSNAQPLLEESSPAASSKQDLERAILIECTELFVLVVEGDWHGVSSLGLAMDLKASSHALHKQHLAVTYDPTAIHSIQSLLTR